MRRCRVRNNWAGGAPSPWARGWASNRSPRIDPKGLVMWGSEPLLRGHFGARSLSYVARTTNRRGFWP
eukprot:7725482-Pyramimonas_sp.AAC.1